MADLRSPLAPLSVYEEAAQHIPGLDALALHNNNILARFVRDYVAAQDKRLARYGLGIGRHIALGLINLQGDAGITAGELAERLGITRGTMTGLIDGLEEAGFVQRRSHRGDRRKVTLVSTAAGRKKLLSYWPSHARSLCEFMGVLSHSEQARVVELLGKLTDALGALSAPTPNSAS